LVFNFLLVMNLSITGFGACMIAGYPHSLETGFLYQAVQNLDQTGGFQVTFDVVAMGGFPVDRAQKHLAKKVLSHQPDIVVLQFGSTDASAPLRNNFVSRRKSHSGSHSSEKVSPQSPAAGDAWKWKLRSFVSELLLVPPLTPLKFYQAAVLGMVEECLAAGSKVVVVSPFVMGSGRSDRFARRYTRALKANLPDAPEVRFLDAYALLSPLPRRQMLLKDGFHLSAKAHQKLGVALARLIAETALNPSKICERADPSGR
jgi:lysophospholipase L1-like esterase